MMPCPSLWGPRTERWKILLIGDQEVGKTSFAYRFSEGIFEDHFEKLLFDEHHVKEAVVDGKKCVVTLLDSWVVQTHYFDMDDDLPACDGCILLYSTTSRSSFQDVARTCRQVPFNPNEDPNLVLILVGTRSDLKSAREVSSDEGAALAKELGCQAFFETSAKSGENVDAAVSAIVQALRKTAAARQFDLTVPLRRLRIFLSNFRRGGEGGGGGGGGRGNAQ